MNVAEKFPWKVAVACSVLMGLFALMAVFAFHPKAPMIACLAFWAGPHLGPFAAFIFSKSASASDVLLGCLIGGLMLLPIGVANVWARILASFAIVFWFLSGLVNVCSGV